MFIDYLTLMLVNMVAGLVLLALFYLKGLSASDGRPWAVGFAATGAVAFLCGLHMSWTWPLPGSYNIAFGEPAALFGISYLAAATVLFLRRNEGEPLAARLMPVGVYTLFAGLAAVVVGLRIMHLGLTRSPVLAGIGFILSGAAGILLPVVCRWWSAKGLRFVAAIVALGAAAIWTLVGYGAYWGHLDSFKGYQPPTVQHAPAPEASAE
jgi:putative membrane protein